MATIKFGVQKTKPYFKPNKSRGYRGVNLLLEPSPKQWWEDPDALVAFNIPRISARLERLMGTNVVRLTDRKYMRELRERIDEDYRKQLANRIKNREIKELERERNLILEGKTDAIPDELAGDPIFVVNKKANVEILKRRAKLKTSREKNADRLMRQGMKWERERLRHEVEELEKQKELEEVRTHQKALEERYIEEDEQRGLDLLRINDVEWQECEQSLRNFLESERNRMKERSWRVPTQFSSDPLDIRNIIRARKEFRAKELERIRLERAEKAKAKQLKKAAHGHKPAYKAATKVSTLVRTVGAFADHLKPESEATESIGSIYLGDDDASDIPSSTGSPHPQVDQLTNIKQLKAKEMETQMDDDVQKGYLVTSEQFRNLRFDNPHINKLRDATHISELYHIAEKIITCSMEDEEIVEEEVEVEDDDNDADE